MTTRYATAGVFADKANTWSATQTFGDNILLIQGADADIVYKLTSAAVAADAEPDAAVYKGTSDHQGTAANSLVLSNTTPNGDFQGLVNNGGNSLEWLLVDTSAKKISLGFGGFYSELYDTLVIADTPQTLSVSQAISAGGADGVTVKERQRLLYAANGNPYYQIWSPSDAGWRTVWWHNLNIYSQGAALETMHFGQPLWINPTLGAGTSVFAFAFEYDGDPAAVPPTSGNQGIGWLGFVTHAYLASQGGSGTMFLGAENYRDMAFATTSTVGGATLPNQAVPRMIFTGSTSVLRQDIIIRQADLVFESTAGIQDSMTFTSAIAGTTELITITNTDSTNVASHARLDIKVTNTTADALVTVSTAAASWYLGVDNSDADKLFLGIGTVVGTTPVMSVYPAGITTTQIPSHSFNAQAHTVSDGATNWYQGYAFAGVTATLAGTTQITALQLLARFGTLTLTKASDAVTVNAATSVGALPAGATGVVTLTHSSAFRAITATGVSVNVSGFYAEAQTAGTTGNYQALFAVSTGAAPALADHVGITARDLAADDTRLYIASQAGSDIILGNDRLRFAAATGIIGIGATDVLSMTTSVITVPSAATIAGAGTGANGMILKNLKNAAASALSGTQLDVQIDIGGTPYYFTVYPTKA